MGIKDETRKRALLLHYSGPEVDKTFDTLEDTGEDKNYKTAVENVPPTLIPKSTQLTRPTAELGQLPYKTQNSCEDL